MRFCLIGNGFIANKHIEAIKHVGGELVAVCDIDPSKEIKGIPFFTDYKEAIKGADAISICTPNHTHTEIILESARLGKKILCEKPMSFKLEELELLKGVPKLYGMFQLRYLPELPEMRQLAKTAKEVSLVVEMKRSKNYHTSWKGDPEKSGGTLVNIGCHYFDLLGHLFGYKKIPDFVKWSIKFVEEQDHYERSLTIDGKRFDLVQKSNLHIRAYEDFMWNQGTWAGEEERIMKMICNL